MKYAIKVSDDREHPRPTRAKRLWDESPGTSRPRTSCTRVSVVSGRSRAAAGDTNSTVFHCFIVRTPSGHCAHGKMYDTRRSLATYKYYSYARSGGVVRGPAFRSDAATFGAVSPARRDVSRSPRLRGPNGRKRSIVRPARLARRPGRVVAPCGSRGSLQTRLSWRDRLNEYRSNYKKQSVEDD